MQFVNVVKPTHICNLSCKYCYNDDLRQPVMADSTLQRTIEQSFAFARSQRAIKSVEFIWHGGEPTVVGLPFYAKVVALQEAEGDGIEYSNSLQTNGILLDDAWVRFLLENRFLVSVSIDGPQWLNDAYRVTHAGKGSFERVFASIRRLRAAEVPFGVCMVLSKLTAPHTEEIFSFFAAEGLPFNIIPMTRSGAARDRFDEIGLEAEEYADAWIPMYDAWLQSGDGGNYVYVQDFVLKTRAIAFGRPADCIGLAYCARFNISTDPVGDVYPCASLSGTQALRYGNINDEDLSGLLASDVARLFKERAVDPQCATCKWQHVCHGGCLSRAYKFHGDINRRDYYCPSLYRMYEHIEQRLHDRGLAPGERYVETAAAI